MCFPWKFKRCTQFGNCKSSCFPPLGCEPLARHPNSLLNPYMLTLSIWLGTQKGISGWKEKPDLLLVLGSTSCSLQRRSELFWVSWRDFLPKAHWLLIHLSKDMNSNWLPRLGNPGLHHRDPFNLVKAKPSKLVYTKSNSLTPVIYAAVPKSSSFDSQTCLPPRLWLSSFGAMRTGREVERSLQLGQRVTFTGVNALALVSTVVIHQ